VVPIALLGLLAGLGMPAPAAVREQQMTILMREYSFTPGAVRLQAGTPVRLTLVNNGNLEHEFQVYPAPGPPGAGWQTYVMRHTYFQDMGEIDVSVPGAAEAGATSVFKVHVAPGARVILWFTPRTRGRFEMACHDPGHYERGMKGTFVVQ
jgi:uncharacterized cupredoxin-like copper-binding protein